MISSTDVLKCPNRSIYLEYTPKATKKKVCKVVLTTVDPKKVKDKDDILIDIDNLIEEVDELFIIPIQ